MFARLYFSLLLAFAVAFILVSSAPVAPESPSLVRFTLPSLSVYFPWMLMTY